MGSPTKSEIEKTNIYRMMQELHIDSYADFHAWSVDNREKFWKKSIDLLNIAFKKPFTQIVDLSRGAEDPNWLVGAKLNIADSCFQADVNATALIFQKEGGSLQTWSYGELNLLSNRVANWLTKAGFLAGDPIAIDMTMTAEAVAIYLGIVKAGCVVVSIADSFAPNEIATRLKIAQAKGVFTQDFILRGGKKLSMYSKIVEAKAPKTIVLPCEEKILVELRKGDRSWDDFLSDEETFESIPCNPNDPMNILFSSGTTGDPKAIPWTYATPIKSAADGFYHHDIQPKDVVAWPTNLGWMMGPWLIYATLINRGTIALYYGPPTGRAFGEFVADSQVNMLGLVPSIVKVWRNTDCMKGLDWSPIKCFSSTGECSNADDYAFLMSLAHNRPVIEYCGGTEIGGGYITGTLVQDFYPATFSTPALGLDIEILNEEGKPADNGELFIVPPSIGLSQTLLNKNHHEVYYEGTPKGKNGRLLRRHGDQMETLPNGHYRAHGRADDTMNLGGIKVSSVEIERTLNTLDGVLETAAIAISPPGGGPSLLVIYAVLQKEIDLENLKSDMQQRIKKELNPLFKIEKVISIEALPRTASNKVMRRLLRDPLL